MAFMRIFSLAVLLPLSMVLASCATMSEDECVAADWRVVGEADGAAGREPQSRFAAHAESCRKTGVVPDQTRWYEGFQQGLVRYCTPLTGLSEGRAGKAYHNVCPPASGEGFLRGYQLGKTVYDRRRALQSIDGRINVMEGEIDRIEKKIAAGEIAARDGDADIRRIRHDVRRARYERRDSELALRDAEAEAEYFARDPRMSRRSGY